MSSAPLNGAVVNGVGDLWSWSHWFEADTVWRPPSNDKTCGAEIDTQVDEDTGEEPCIPTSRQARDALDIIKSYMDHNDKFDIVDIDFLVDILYYNL